MALFNKKPGSQPDEFRSTPPQRDETPAHATAALVVAPREPITPERKGNEFHLATPDLPQPQPVQTPAVLPGNQLTKPIAEAKEPPMEKKETKSTLTLLEDAEPHRRSSAQENSATAAQRGLSRGEGQTLISADTIVEGRVTAKSEIRIDGTFKGEIISDDRIVVGTSGDVEATVEAAGMVISGRVVGNLKIRERLELLSTGEIYGDLEIQPGALIIEKGAKLEGRCTMGLEKAKTSSRPTTEPHPTI